MNWTAFADYLLENAQEISEEGGKEADLTIGVAKLMTGRLLITIAGGIYKGLISIEEGERDENGELKEIPF